MKKPELDVFTLSNQLALALDNKNLTQRKTNVQSMSKKQNNSHLKPNP